MIYSIIQKSLELKLLLNNSLGRVLMFHQVDDKQNWQHEYLSIINKSFERLIISLLDQGYKLISLHDHENGIQLSPKSIVLTFDDGYACIYFSYL